MNHLETSNTPAKTIEELKKKTGFDEVTIGCCLSNFMDRNVCPRFRNSGCRNLEHCRAITAIISE